VNGSGTQSSASNAFNEITNIYSSTGTTNSYVYTYDNNGNRLTTAVHPPGGQPVQTTTYAWNDDDRMSGVTFPSGATNTYGYDANGIRVSKKDSVSNVNYLIDPQTQSILATYDAVAGTRLTSFNQNPQKIDEVLSYQVNGLKYYPHADMLGSVYAVSDVTTKAVATWTYDVWGTRTQATGTLTYPFGFTGREHDPDTGLIYARQRYYDPTDGQWLSVDREVMINGPNQYAYALDRPTLLVDPSGNIALAAPVVLLAPWVLEVILVAIFVVIAIDLILIAWGALTLGPATDLSCPSFASKADPLTQRPREAPTGTVPIDQVPDLDRNDIHTIKDDVWGPGSADKWTGVAPNGDIIIPDENGNTQPDVGNVKDY
jgi:RHS repeat-associated protein